MKQFESILLRVIGGKPGDKGLGGVDISSQFTPDSPGDTARNLNAAFFIALCDPHHPLCGKALAYLEARSRDAEWSATALFYLDGLRRIREEVGTLVQNDD